MDIKVEAPQRKPYHTPVLQVYGGIHALTKSAGMVNNDDGMATGNTKTS